MIYIATQKAFTPPKQEGYRLIHVGAAKKKSIGIYRDDTGDNISKKNPTFRELTGLYWIWKNSAVPCKGLVLPGRYFGKKSFSRKPEDVYTHAEMEAFLQATDIVLPCAENFSRTVRDELLEHCCTELVFDQLREVVEFLYPDYLADFDGFFAQNQCALSNMLFCRAELFDSYCQWLFDILFELERHVNLRCLGKHQQQLYGSLAERLLNVYVRHHHLTCRYLPVVQPGVSFRQKLSLQLRQFTYPIIFRLRKHS